jgi:hypothetical protein
MDLAHNLVSGFIRRQEGRESFRVSVSLCNLPMSDTGECGTSYYVRFSRVALEYRNVYCSWISESIERQSNKYLVPTTSML